MKNPIKMNLKTEILPILCVIFSGVSSIMLYPKMPEKIPIHWNFRGEIDNWGNSFSHVIAINAMIIGIYLMFIFMPYLDPKKERYEQFEKIYHIIKNVLMIFLTGILFMTNLSAIGYPINVALYIPIAVGILFIILGNYMGKIKPNWFVGIRTPWTLSSEETWNKSHRLSGKIFMLSGFLIAINGFLPEILRLPVFIFAIVIILFGTLVGSYIIYRKNK
ncbi:MAG: SdpI family protein [Patescibacteria group bacterium]|nr:SdpI family protein [Patescibacteria group bacterium]MDD4303905.1 SdpI family protein [Patescibacteria group bacterium]MDD4695108.1 SdpI family protein [Patescibacteria group bacterium]